MPRLGVFVLSNYFAVIYVPVYSNEPGERLIGVFSFETNTCGPEWAIGDGDD